MMNKRQRIFFVLLVFNLFLIALNGNAFRSLSVCRHASEGKLYRYSREFSGLVGMTDYCVHGENVYLLFEGMGTIKVYDLSGNYLHSFAYHTITAGSSFLHVDTNHAYLEDQSHNIYSFRNGEFEKYYSYESGISPKHFNDNDFYKRASSDGVRYQKRWASIIALMPNGAKKTIISRPFFLIWVDNHAPIIINFLLIFGFIIVHIPFRKIIKVEKKTNDGSLSA